MTIRTNHLRLVVETCARLHPYSSSSLPLQSRFPRLRHFPSLRTLTTQSPRTLRRHEAETYTTTLNRSRRKFTTSTVLNHGHLDAPKPGEEVHVTFITKEGEEHTYNVCEGDNLLDIAQANDLEMEGMAHIIRGMRNGGLTSGIRSCWEI